MEAEAGAEATPTRAEAESHRQISAAPDVRILTPEELTVAEVTAFPEGVTQGIHGHQSDLSFKTKFTINLIVQLVIECFSYKFTVFLNCFPVILISRS